MVFNRALFQRQTSRTKAGTVKVATGVASLSLGKVKSALGARFPGVKIPSASFPSPGDLVSKIKNPIVPLPSISVPPISAEALTATLNETTAAATALSKRGALEAISEKLPSFEALKGFSKLSPSNLGSLVPPQVGSALAAAKAGAARVQAGISQAQAIAADVKAQAQSAVQSAAATAQGAIQGAANQALSTAREQSASAIQTAKTAATNAWKANT